MRREKTIELLRLATAAVFLVACLSQIAPAQAPSGDKTTPPPPGKMRPFQFPGYETRTLDNGLRVYVIEDHRQHVVSLDLVIDAGASAHAPERAGLASLTAALLRQGTSTRSAQDIARAIDYVGGSLNTSAGDDVAQTSVTVVKSSLDLGLELLSDVVLKPTFQQEELDRLRRQTLSGIQVQYTDPEYLAPASAARVIYGKHPYGYPVEGTPDSLRAITREQIQAFHRDHYSPQAAWLAVSGDITPEEAFAGAEKYFGKWATLRRPSPPPTPPPAAARSILVVDKPDAVQTQIVVGQLAINRTDPDYLPLLIANQILGGSFGSRLNLKLRAEEGLTYGARSRFDTQRQAGSFVATTFTRTEETGRAIRLVLDILRDFRQNPATEEELKEAKAFLTGSFALGVETPGQVAGRVLTLAQYGLPADYWNRYRSEIDAVTAAQIQAAVARRLNPQRMAVVAVGNATAFAADIKALGEARTILFSDLDFLSPDLARPKETTSAATPESRQRAATLVEAAVEAAGGLAALQEVRNAVTLGSVSILTPQGSIQGEVRSEAIYPDKMRSTLELPVGSIVQGFDGQKAWMQQGAQSMELPALMHDEMRRTLLLQGGIGVLREAVSGRAEIQALETETLEGKELAPISWSLGSLALKIYFDPESHRIARVRFRSVTPQGASEVESIWTEFNEFSGLRLPSRMVTLRDGQKFSEITIKEVLFNQELDPASFAKP